MSQGDVDGWSWGPGSVISAIEPPLTSFEEICSQDVQSSTVNDEPVLVEGPSIVSLAVFFGIFVLIAAALVRYKRRGNTGE